MAWTDIGKSVLYTPQHLTRYDTPFITEMRMKQGIISDFTPYFETEWDDDGSYNIIINQETVYRVRRYDMIILDDADALDILVAFSASPKDWYDRDYEWFEAVNYQTDPFKIFGISAHYSFADALDLCRRMLLPENSFGRNDFEWRIIHHLPDCKPRKIAESKIKQHNYL